MKNYLTLFGVILCFQYCYSQCRKNDTLYIYFDEKIEGMSKQIIPKERLMVKGDIPGENSYVYEIQEKEDGFLYESAYKFSHFNWSKRKLLPKDYSKPIIIEKDSSFLVGKRILTNTFFKNTPYSEVCKTFELEDRREQNVILFVIDVSEIKNNNLVLREVNFSRPVKE